VPDKKAKRKPKEASPPRDSEGIRSLAGELREVADRLEAYADTMKEMGIPSIKPLTGNFHQALEKIRVFTAQQVLAKLMVEAERSGKDAHEIFGPNAK
jgi:hypothetical protein